MKQKAIMKGLVSVAQAAGIPVTSGEIENMKQWAEHQGNSRIIEEAKATQNLMLLPQILAGAEPPPDPASKLDITKCITARGTGGDRVVPAHLGIMAQLGDTGFFSRPLFAKARELCCKVGMADWDKLPVDIRLGILKGIMIHPGAKSSN